MTEPLVWPHHLLKPAQIVPNPVAFTRSGGRTIGGISRNTRTDKGYWSIVYKGLTLPTPEHRRQWNIIRNHAGGAAGLLAVPVWSYDTAEWPAGTINGLLATFHSDGSGFSDGSYYTQPAIVVENVALAEIGDTSITLRAVWNITELAGIRFSYEHALYETGLPTLVDGDEWTVPIFPAIRADIPADAVLEVGMPTCLVHLAADREMDVSFSASKIDRVEVAFLEAVDEWNDRALA